MKRIVATAVVDRDDLIIVLALVHDLDHGRDAVGNIGFLVEARDDDGDQPGRRGDDSLAAERFSSGCS